MSYEVLLWIGGIVIGLIGYLLSRRDAAQAEQIADLYAKHETDAKALQDLQVKVASEHYVKQELDARFIKLESLIDAGLRGLGEKMDKLTDALLEHIKKEWKEQR